MSSNPPEDNEDRPQVLAGQNENGEIYVVARDAMAVLPPAREPADESEDGELEDSGVEVDDAENTAVRPTVGRTESDLTNMVPQPDKVMRIASMTQKLLDEIKAAPLDDGSRRRLGEAYEASIEELKGGVDPELADELERITEPFGENATPSDAELRVAQAQLVGWLEGLFHGLQTALFAQQMAARAQLEQMRHRALPPGVHPEAPTPGQNQPGQKPGGSGMYL